LIVPELILLAFIPEPTLDPDKIPSAKSARSVSNLEGDSSSQENPIKLKVNEALTVSSEIPINLEKIATHFGYKIKDLDFEDDFSGMLVKKTIYTNSAEKDKFPTRHRFTIAHELGHALIHKSENHQYKPVRFRSDSISLDEKKLEQEANQFAAWLLMPEVELLNELDNKDSISEDEIREIAKKFNVSFSAMNYRLSDLGYF
jgi:Zn-dependent peptidase ImmA (M78 family)